ncbi:MAG: carbonic anhydrase [Xanthomonadaceae bacterium]|nr:carbonic anhydrase [Xanthomonadaceae bacterium]
MHENVEHDHCCSADPEQPSSRRRFLGTAAALGALGGLSLASGEGILGSAHAAELPAAGPDSQMTPEQALAEVMAGNARFLSGTPVAHQHDLRIIRERAAEGQWPIVGVLSCADSRVPVEMVFDEPIGRLFTCRIAGNITTPEIIGSLEYGVAVLGIKAILVMGHSSCGAVKSAIDNPEVPGQISSLFPALLPAIYLSDSKDAATVTKTNAIVQAATLINASPVIESAVKSGNLKVVPAVYDVGTSKVELLDIPPSIRLAGR